MTLMFPSLDITNTTTTFIIAYSIFFTSPTIYYERHFVFSILITTSGGNYHYAHLIYLYFLLKTEVLWAFPWLKLTAT